MELITLIVLGLALAWASGINVYAAVVLIGFLGASGYIALPESLQVLSHPFVISLAAFMYLVEFIADKVPGFDSLWDTLHSFIRIPAGALLAAAAVTDIGPVAELSAALAGGSLAAATHLTKAGSRLLINTSPEPVSNWSASITEDALVLGGLWLAVMYPGVFAVLLVLFIAVLIWAIPKLWRQIKKVFEQIRRWLGGQVTREASAALTPDLLPAPPSHKRNPPPPE